MKDIIQILFGLAVSAVAAAVIFVGYAYGMRALVQFLIY